jgi:hypothetical protein
MVTPSKNWRQRRTEHRIYAEIATDTTPQNSERKDTQQEHTNS